VVSRYWQLQFVPDQRTGESEWLERLQGHLADAVKSHMVSDVPIGAFLSGGVDSSSVVVLMAQASSTPIRTFSIGFAEADFDELAFARQVATRYGTDHYELVVKPNAVDVLPKLAWHFDEPFADPSAVPTYLVCGDARRTVTVCLTGDGGDENFGGYRRYRANEARRSIRGLLAADRVPALLAAAGRVAPEAPWIPKPLRLRTALRDAAVSPRAAYRKEMSIASPETKRVLYGERLKRAVEGHDPFSILDRHFGRAEGWDSTSSLQYADFKSYLPDGILTKMDRASMAHGLEARVPLLDQALVEFVAAMPSSSKATRGKGKRLLRGALRHMVPARILNRRKRGFTPPVARWLDGKTGALFTDRVLGRDSFVSGCLDIEGVRGIWESQRGGARRDTQLLWAVLILECWGRRFL
jgi:asparagine synthase (glutamine-hydrolysing)